jgi:hypothetical protein
LDQKAATTGTTDVANAGFEKIVKPAESKEATELKFSGGGLLATGNSRSLSLTGTGALRLRRAENEYSANFAGNYGRAAATPAESRGTWSDAGSMRNACKLAAWVRINRSPTTPPMPASNRTGASSSRLATSK